YFKTKTTNKIKKINHSSKKIPHLYMANQSEFENSHPYDTNLKKRSQLKTIDNRNKNIRQKKSILCDVIVTNQPNICLHSWQMEKAGLNLEKKKKLFIIYLLKD